MTQFKLFNRQYKILTTDSDIKNHDKYAKIIEKLNHNFAGSADLSDAIIDTYAETLNYEPTMDLAVEDIGEINKQYEKYMQNSMTTNEKVNLLKSLARDHFAGKTYNVFDNICA